MNLFAMERKKESPLKIKGNKVIVTNTNLKGEKFYITVTDGENKKYFLFREVENGYEQISSSKTPLNFDEIIYD